MPVTLIHLKDYPKSNLTVLDLPGDFIISSAYEKRHCSAGTREGVQIQLCVFLNAFTVCGNESMHLGRTAVGACKHALIQTICTGRCSNTQNVYDENEH